MKNMIQERNLSALAEVRNIIAQEIYKISVVKQYPDEFLRIIELYQNVSKKIVAVGIIDESESLYRFKRKLVNCVVEEQSASECRENLIPIINTIAEENYGKEKETAISLKKILSEVFKSNRGFNSTIPHKYPPELLIEWRDYIDIYEFYHNKNYESKHIREKVKDDSSFMEKGEYRNVITFYPPPVTIVRPYARRLLSTSELNETIEVPMSAYSKDRKPKIFVAENPLDMKKANLLYMASYNDVSYVKVTKELKFSINLQEPISQNDLELIISNIRTQISLAQRFNSLSLQLIATTDDEINHAFDIEELSVPSYGEKELIMSAKKPEIPDFKVALKVLAGLLFMQKTSLILNKSSGCYTWRKRKGTKISTEIDILRIELNKKFTTEENINTNADEIKNNYLSEGYKQVLDGVNYHLQSFQHKRVQFDVTLNAEQRLALKDAPEINLNDLHDDDIELAKKKISAHKKQGRDASVRIRKNGSYVITW